jgi:UDP-N-acetylmuramoyl-tripeptide--D-alanyl-D-alanine ligase
MRIFKGILVWILTIESRLIIKKYKPFIVAITGSVGKTSTKDAIYCVLKNSERFARKSEKSMNSEIGLPLTIIGAPNAWRNLFGWIRNIIFGATMIVNKVDYPSCLILEIGADHPGDIKRVVKWLHPDIVVITKISKTPVHVEFFNSSEDVFEEKSALVGAVKDDGVLILFADDDRVVSLAEMVKGKNVRVLTFGIDKPATARGEDYTSSIQSGISFTLDLIGEKAPICINNVLGKIYLYPLLAAAAVGKARNISLLNIAKSLNRFEAPKGRMNIIPGINGSMIIDDTYNSSPDAAISALLTLKELDRNESSSVPEKSSAGWKVTKKIKDLANGFIDKAINSFRHLANGKNDNKENQGDIDTYQSNGRKIAVLGDMMELGKYSADEHKKIGREAANIVDILIAVGPRSRVMAEEAQKSGMPANCVKCFDSSNEAASYIVSIVSAGDIILVKGSQSPRLERVTKALLREPEKADKLIVRQEEEWLKKQ